MPSAIERSSAPSSSVRALVELGRWRRVGETGGHLLAARRAGRAGRRARPAARRAALSAAGRLELRTRRRRAAPARRRAAPDRRRAAPARHRAASRPASICAWPSASCCWHPPLLRLVGALLLGLERIDHRGDVGQSPRRSTSAEIASFCSSVNAEPSVVVKTTVPRRTAEVGQLLGELVDHVAGGGAGDVEARGERAEADQEAADGDAEDDDPRDDHHPGAACGELSQSVQQFSHVVSSVKSGLSRYGTECLVAKSVIEFPARAQPGCGADAPSPTRARMPPPPAPEYGGVN